MALEHEFYLIPNTVDVGSFWIQRQDHPNVIDSVVIHDDIILYISDTLKCIFSAWRDLFLNSPAVLELIGEFAMTEDGDGVKSGQYEKLVYNRDEIVRQFEKMISLSDKLSEGNLYLYHCGI